MNNYRKAKAIQGIFPKWEDIFTNTADGLDKWRDSPNHDIDYSCFRKMFVYDGGFQIIGNFAAACISHRFNEPELIVIAAPREIGLYGAIADKYGIRRPAMTKLAHLIHGIRSGDIKELLKTFYKVPDDEAVSIQYLFNSIMHANKINLRYNNSPSKEEITRHADFLRDFAK